MPIPEKPSFATTHWSEVRRAANLTGDAGDALERLCASYWYPLYAFLRRSGHDADAAQDYVQSFFVDLLSRESLQAADPSRGKFRTFLLTACKNHVANLIRADRALRRGGGHKRIPMHTTDGEQIYETEPVEQWSPEKLFLRRWALAVIDTALAAVRAEYESKGRRNRFEILCPLIAPAGSPPSHAELAEKLDCSVGAVKVAAHRLRQQFASALRAEIATTVDITDERDEKEAIDEELQVLMQALRGQ